MRRCLFATLAMSVLGFADGRQIPARPTEMSGLLGGQPLPAGQPHAIEGVKIGRRSGINFACRLAVVRRTLRPGLATCRRRSVDLWRPGKRARSTERKGAKGKVDDQTTTKPP